MTSTHINQTVSQHFTGSCRADTLIQRMATCLLVVIIALMQPTSSGSMNAGGKMMGATYGKTTRKSSETGFVINHENPRVRGGKEPVVFPSAHLPESMGIAPLITGIRRSGERHDSGTTSLVFIAARTSSKECFHVRNPGYDLDVFFLRVPEVLPAIEGGFPVAPSGRVAAHRVGAARASGHFIINADAYAGNSGAPVIVSSRGSHPEPVGMSIQRIGPEEQKYAHSAIAVDEDFLRETLKLLELRDAWPVPVVRKKT